MLHLEGAAVLALAAKRGTVDVWEIVLKALREELSREQVYYTVPGQRPCFTAESDMRFLSTFIHYRELYPCILDAAIGCGMLAVIACNGVTGINSMPIFIGFNMLCCFRRVLQVLLKNYLHGGCTTVHFLLQPSHRCSH